MREMQDTDGRPMAFYPDATGIHPQGAIRAMDGDGKWGWSVPRTVLPTTEDITPNEADGERLMVGGEILPLGTVGRRPYSLDDAWAEAEAALPEGWAMKSVSMDAPPDWQAWCGATPEETLAGDAWEAAYGPTPAAALRALAAKLRERDSGRCSSVKPGTVLRCMRLVGHHEPHTNTTLPSVESEWERAG